MSSSDQKPPLDPADKQSFPPPPPGPPPSRPHRFPSTQTRPLFQTTISPGTTRSIPNSRRRRVVLTTISTTRRQHLNTRLNSRHLAMVTTMAKRRRSPSSLDWGVPANQKGKEKEKASPQHPPTPASPSLSADNTHFQTAPLSPGELTDPLEDPTKGRKPSALREAIGKPVYSYVKSHGVYAGVQISGTVILSRDTANAKFYGRPVTVQEILDGKVEPPAAAKTLFDVLSGASGWRGQSGTSPVTPNFAPGTGVPPATPAATTGVAGVTAGVRGLDVGGPSSSTTAPRPTTPVVNAKAAEAAAEARLASPTSPPPPSYSEFAPAATQQQHEDLPPAYVEGQGTRPRAGDSKTGLH
ncbi:hypothetical protein B0T21DRAFT_78285 [Apiosordaria backusii]|uniref:Ysc84 actin-binding domain-containing protein n=1 Tax=Apiosordaria backusii TaxID=314023 RepID=A0AA40A7B5_9PEZI|nr:hypothetical protein B0T21DRAFT_78285 [Apiosordaria backusii]